MKFGIFSNGLRARQIAADTYDADLEEIVAADAFGFHEAWISEHFGGWFPDVVPFAELLIAKAAGLTKTIRLGPAVRLLPVFHPLDVATSAAMCDHLLRGRYMFGFGSGVPFVRNMERRNLTNEQRHPMMLEALAYIEKCWSASEPFDWGGPHWPGKQITISPKPYQKPHPPIAVATSQGPVVSMAAQRGWSVMIGQFDSPGSIRARAQAYANAGRAAGTAVDRNRITVARHIHVGDSLAAAKNEIRDAVDFAIREWKERDPSRFHGYMPPSGDVADVNFDQAFDSGLFIAGNPDQVYRQLAALYEASGGFGTLLVVLGKDWGTAPQRLRSMRLFMEQVAPRLAALDANLTAAAADESTAAQNQGEASLQAAAY